MNPKCTFLVVSQMSALTQIAPGQPPVQVIVAPVPVLRPDIVPTHYTFAVTIGLDGIDLQKPDPSTIRIEMCDPDGVPVIQSMQLPIKASEGHAKEADGSAVVSGMLANVYLSKGGQYQIKIEVDGVSMNEWLIEVRPRRVAE